MWVGWRIMQGWGWVTFILGCFFSGCSSAGYCFAGVGGIPCQWGHRGRGLQGIRIRERYGYPQGKRGGAGQGCRPQSLSGPQKYPLDQPGLVSRGQNVPTRPERSGTGRYRRRWLGRLHRIHLPYRSGRSPIHPRSVFWNQKKDHRGLLLHKSNSPSKVMRR